MLMATKGTEGAKNSLPLIHHVVPGSVGLDLVSSLAFTRGASRDRSAHAIGFFASLRMTGRGHFASFVAKSIGRLTHA